MKMCLLRLLCAFENWMLLHEQKKMTKIFTGKRCVLLGKNDILVILEIINGIPSHQQKTFLFLQNFSLQTKIILGPKSTVCCVLLTIFRL